MVSRLVKAGKVTALAAFIVLSICVGTWRELHPPSPTRQENNPYNVTLAQLAAHASALEGEIIVITRDAWNVSFDQSSATLAFSMIDDVHGIHVDVVYANASDHDGIQDGRTVTVKAEARLESEGILVGIDLKVLSPGRVYALSIAGGGILAIMIFMHFKVKWRRFALVTKKTGDTERHGDLAHGGEVNA